MASEQPSQIPQFEISTITEQELQKPGAPKIIAKRVIELEVECKRLIRCAEDERAGREKLTSEFHKADSQRQILEARIEALGNRNAITQLIWGALAIFVGLIIEFIKSCQWTDLFLCLIAVALLVLALYLVNRSASVKKPDAPMSAARGQ